MERQRTSRTNDWVGRDDAITGRAEQYVCVARHFFPFFTRPSAAYRRLKILIGKGNLRVIGRELIDETGRPQTVICNGWRPTHLRHDVLVTDVLLAYPEAKSVCGPKVDRRYRADGEMIFADGRTFYLELDTGKPSYRQHRRRQDIYRGLSPTAGVLFVTLGERRLRGIIEHIGALRDFAYFALHKDVLRDPYGKIWRDSAGENGALVRRTSPPTL